MSSFYEQRTLRLLERYEFPDNVRRLLKAYDEVKTCMLDEASLGRLIRLSPNNRAALVSTMVKCASIMKENPKEGKYCLIFITTCGEMLEIADKPPPAVGFPGFSKLPTEIRHRVYDLYLNNHETAPNIISIRKKEKCVCSPHEPPIYERFQSVPMDLAFTSKDISREVLTYFYRKRRFYFPCACEMGCYLKTNMLFNSTINSIMFHWCGEYAAESILRLQKLEELKSLTIVISKLTSKRLTDREIQIRQYFHHRRPAHAILPESRGWDELIAIRGLHQVEVVHINKRKADRRTDDERSSLEAMLSSRLLKMPEDDD